MSSPHNTVFDIQNREFEELTGPSTSPLGPVLTISSAELRTEGSIVREAMLGVRDPFLPNLHDQYRKDPSHPNP